MPDILPLPHDFSWDIPKEEADAVFFLEGRLRELAVQALEFRWALNLSDQAEDQLVELKRKKAAIVSPRTTTLPDEERRRLLNEYYGLILPIQQMIDPLEATQRMAVRDSIMTVFHIANILSSLPSLPGCPRFAKSCDLDLLKRQVRIFKTARFPDWECMRHAVAHLGELKKTTAAAEKNTFSGTWSGRGVTLKNSKMTTLMLVSGRELTLTYEGRVLSFRLDQAKADDIFDTVNSVRAVFIAGAASFRPRNRAVWY